MTDLENGYVVPRFGDAHSHHFDGAFNIRQLTEMYLRDGIFYAKIPGNARADLVTLRKFTDQGKERQVHGNHD